MPRILHKCLQPSISTISLLALLGLILSTVQTVSFRHSEKHSLVQVSSQCCTQKGYVQCGKVNKDCCKKGCITSWLMEFCDGGDQNILKQPCQNTCIKVCEGMGGVMCSHGYVGEMMCCKQEDCVGSLKGECKRDSQFDLGQCIPDSETEKSTDTATDLIGTVWGSINPF